MRYLTFCVVSPFLNMNIQGNTSCWIGERGQPGLLALQRYSISLPQDIFVHLQQLAVVRQAIFVHLQQLAVVRQALLPVINGPISIYGNTGETTNMSACLCASFSQFLIGRQISYLKVLLACSYKNLLVLTTLTVVRTEMGKISRTLANWKSKSNHVYKRWF